MYKHCIMGCPFEKGSTLHCFPQNPKRRAEWIRILGIYPRAKRVFLCDKHFPDYFILGNRISVFAIPNPPESRNLTTSYNDYNIADEIEEDNFKADFEIPQEVKEEKKDPPEIQENKIETFEIRKRNNSDMIIKGRFIQTDNYLMVSYTPPRKWSLQRQLKILDEHCTRQLRQIRRICRENELLSSELKKYEKILPKLRYLQKHNRFLYAQLKIYELKAKDDRKRKMKRKLKNHENVEMFSHNSTESK